MIGQMDSARSAITRCQRAAAAQTYSARSNEENPGRCRSREVLVVVFPGSVLGWCERFEQKEMAVAKKIGCCDEGLGVVFSHDNEPAGCQ